MTLAHQIKPLFATFSEALKEAWKQAKADVIELIEFTKKSGETTKRIVSRNWTKYQAPTGTGRSKPSKLNIFADLVKVAKGAKSCIISCYHYTTL